MKKLSFKDGVIAGRLAQDVAIKQNVLYEKLRKGEIPPGAETQATLDLKDVIYILGLLEDMSNDTIET